MNWIDIFILVVLAYCGLKGLSRGFLREVSGLAVLVIAAILATRWRPEVFVYIHPYIQDNYLSNLISYIFLFLILTLIGGNLISVLVSNIHLSITKGIDRFCGIFFGILKGYVFLAILYIGASMVIPNTKWPAAAQNSNGLPFIYRGAVYIQNMLSDVIKVSPFVPPNLTKAFDHSAQTIIAPPHNKESGFVV